jgi:hypothetical protein
MFFESIMIFYWFTDKEVIVLLCTFYRSICMALLKIVVSLKQHNFI